MTCLYVPDRRLVEASAAAAAVTIMQGQMKKALLGDSSTSLCKLVMPMINTITA